MSELNSELKIVRRSTALLRYPPNVSGTPTLGLYLGPLCARGLVSSAGTPPLHYGRDLLVQNTSYERRRNSSIAVPSLVIQTCCAGDVSQLGQSRKAVHSWYTVLFMSITWGHGGHSTNIGLNSCTRAGEIYDGGLLQTRSHATSATAAKMAAAPARDWPFSRSPSRAKPKAADHSGWAV